MAIRRSGSLKVNRKKVGGSRIIRGNYLGNKESWRALSDKIKKRDGYCCRKCGRNRIQIRAANEFLEVDHILPISKGGTDQPPNLWTLCSTCHSKRPGHKHLQKRRNHNANPISKHPAGGYKIGSLSR